MSEPLDAFLDTLRSQKSPTELMTEELRRTLPRLYEQEKLGHDAIVYVKYFSPYSNWIWYVTEFDGYDEFFGFVRGFEDELGYFTLSEFESQGALIERDLYFEPKTLRDIMDDLTQERKD